MKAFLVVAAIAALALGGIYIATPDSVDSGPGCCGNKNTPAVSGEAACPADGGDCCAGMLSAAKAIAAEDAKTAGEAPKKCEKCEKFKEGCEACQTAAGK
jgi:hypothetical protein